MMQRSREIEGITFERQNSQMLIHYNRGEIIRLGMKTGTIYEGYDHEISEVFVYDLHKR